MGEGGGEGDGRGRRPTRVEAAYQALKRRILANELPPGHQALEQELALGLGMSRTPVREALIRLEKEGLVEIIPRRGMRVTALSAIDMRELYDILTCTEAKAVELIARRRPGRREMALLERQVDAMAGALERDDLNAWAVADSRFHELLFELCGNRRLAQIGLAHLEQAHRVRLFTLKLRQKPFRSTDDHRALLALIRDGKAEAARELNRRHRQEAQEELVGILDRFQHLQL